MDLSLIVSYFSCFLVFFKTIGVLGDDEIASTTKAPIFTCAECGSSRGITRQKELLDALDQFLDVRGGIHYPQIDQNCNRPRNISAIKNRTPCITNYCYSITFRDKEGIPLTLRGCAEYFIAVANLKQSYCKKLTKSLDIVECVCRGADSCQNSSSSKNGMTIFSLSHFAVLLFAYFAFLRWWHGSWSCVSGCSVYDGRVMFVYSAFSELWSVMLQFYEFHTCTVFMISSVFKHDYMSSVFAWFF